MLKLYTPGVDSCMGDKRSYNDYFSGKIPNKLHD